MRRIASTRPAFSHTESMLSLFRSFSLSLPRPPSRSQSRLLDLLENAIRPNEVRVPTTIDRGGPRRLSHTKKKKKQRRSTPVMRCCRLEVTGPARKEQDKGDREREKNLPSGTRSRAHQIVGGYILGRWIEKGKRKKENELS